MSIESDAATIGLLFSGGLDSAVLSAQLLSQGRRVVPIYVQTGCAWDEFELAAARRFLGAVRHERLEELVVLCQPLDDLYGDHWSITGADAPDGDSPDEAVFMPGRNPLLLIKPTLWCCLHGVGQLAMATLENNPFQDATPQFFTRFESMIDEATGGVVAIVRPFEDMSKRQVMALGSHLPLELTFSCLAPVGGMHCGQCNKCAERRRAYRAAGVADRTPYANWRPPVAGASGQRS